MKELLQHQIWCSFPALGPLSVCMPWPWKQTGENLRWHTLRWRMSQPCSTGGYHTRDEDLFVFAHPCPPSFFKRRNIRSLLRRLLASITSFLIRITSSASIVTNIHKRSNDVEVRHYTPFREQDWCPERCGVIKAANVKPQSWMLTSIFLPLEHPSY